MSKDVNHLLFVKIVTDHNLRGNTHSIFKFLHSYFIHKEKPFLISNEKITVNSGCGERNISYCLDKLEELKIIKRIGKSFNRRFTQGDVYLYEKALLINNNTQVQTLHACEDINQFNNSTQVQPLHRQVQPLHEQVQPLHISLPSLQDHTTTVVVVFSEKIDFQIIEAHKKRNVVHEFIKNEQDLLDAFKWAVNSRPENISEQQRINGLIGFIKNGCFDVPQGWVNKKISKSKEGLIEYQLFISQLKNDMRIGCASKETQIPDFETWRLTRANRLH